ncbi:MAG: sulfite exporter TauE/SafE family protein [Dehalococcoidia bacterium]|nr:sulfite exporter TauE/SafE family protein [Dehalococcoidia bacterium]
MDFVITLGLGLFAGTLAGLLGIGGGIVMVPGMVLMLGLDQHTAQGISLGAMTVLSLSGCYVQIKQKNLKIPIVIWIAPVAVVFGLLGAYVAGKIESYTLGRLFGAFLLINGSQMLFRTVRKMRTSV